MDGQDLVNLCVAVVVICGALVVGDTGGKYLQKYDAWITRKLDEKRRRRQPEVRPERVATSAAPVAEVRR